MEEIIQRLTEITTHQHQFVEQLASRQEWMEQTVEMLLAAARVPLPDPSASAHHLTILSDQDDIEVYLHTFEVVATGENWDR